MPNQTTLKTPRLLLRAAEFADAERLFPAFTDPEVMKYWSEPPHQSITRTREWLASMTNSPQNGVTDFVICLKDDADHRSITEKVIGKIGIYAPLPANEIGFLLGREYWHKGYAREALRCILEYLFSLRREGLSTGKGDEDRGGEGMGEDREEESGFTKLSGAEMRSAWLYPSVSADVDPRNAACIKLLKGMGFEESGYVEDAMVIAGESVDSLYLRMEREKWMEDRVKVEKAVNTSMTLA